MSFFDQVFSEIAHSAIHLERAVSAETIATRFAAACVTHFGKVEAGDDEGEQTFAQSLQIRWVLERLDRLYPGEAATAQFSQGCAANTGLEFQMKLRGVV